MANLLERASVVLSPTAYNNGEALCVKPDDGSGDFQFSRNSAATRVNAQGLVEDVQILSSNLVQNGDFSEQGAEEVSNGSFSQQGSQLVTNGDFATDTNWVKGTGWSIGGGTANCDGSQTSQTNFFQVGIVPINVNYKVTFTTTVSAGGVILAIGGSNAQPIVTSSGTYTFTDKATSGDANLYLSGNADFIGSIDNVSVVEVGQDWDLGTGWSIADNKAVCDGTNIAYLTQTGVLATGTSYRVQFDIVDYTSGSVKYRDNGLVSGQSFSGVGSYTDYVVAGGGQFRLMSENFIGSVTNISVKEVGQNWNTSAGITIQDEVCKFISTGSGGALTSTTAQLISGKQYLVKFEITYQDGTSKVKINNSGSSGVFKGNVNLYEQVFTCTSTAYLQFYFTNAGSCFIDNISVIEITNDTNLPRINYEGFSFDGSGDIIPDSGCGSWLWEPQSTNLIPYSEDFSQSVWNKSNVTLTSNNAVSPNGTQNASKLVATGADGNLQDTIIVTSGTTYTLSVYLKTISGTLNTAIGLGSPGFPQNEGEGGRYKNIIVTNEWKRYTLTSTADASASTGIGVGGYNTFSTGEEVLVWGIQVEQQSYATSYIPTDGQASGVTRNQDVCTNGGSVSTINSTEGVLYFEGSALADDGTYRLISLEDNSDSSTFAYIGYKDTSNTIRVRVEIGGTLSADMEFVLTSAKDLNKIAFKWKTNDFALWVNGVEVSTDTSGASFTANTLDSVNFSRNGINNFFGNTKCLAVWKEALTDLELQKLTTI